MADRPIQGFNVSTLVTGSSGPELAGEFQELEFSIKNGTEEYLELGERIAAILDGEIKIGDKFNDITKYCDDVFLWENIIDELYNRLVKLD